MKLNTFSFFTAILFFTTTLHAQADTSAQNNSPFAKGTKALLFQVSNNFTLRSFEGGLISFKRHFSEKNALRISISFSGKHDEYKEQRVSHPADSSNYYHKYMTSFVQTSINATFVRYINSTHNVKSYLGLGINIGYDHKFVSYYQYSEPGMNEWTLGPLGIIGAEWFPHPNISVIAEYNCSGFVSFGKGYIQKSKSSVGTIYKTTTKSWGYGFGEQNVRFGLSVYL